MKLLFVVRHSGYVRNFESTLRALCDRGHRVHLAFQIGTHELLDPSDVTGEMAATYRRFTRGKIPVRDDVWGYAARQLRVELDYLRYLTPEYRHAAKLRERATRDVDESLVQRMQGALGSRPGRALVSGWRRLQHRAVPRDPRIDAYLEVVQPDVLVVTPLVQPGAPQAEYLRSARALGIRTALCVASWDNLTNKGLIHGPVDLVTVWNEAMKAEAVQLHGVPPERVVVTGAQPFDHWFDWQPSRTREAFCAAVGLPSGQPYILYLCSSRFIAPDEVPYVRTWLDRLRTAASPALREAGVLIRPHPQNADQWRGVDLSGFGPVAVWPAAGAPPTDTRSRSDYFDSMFHSAAVVGVNTTAEIESAIVGRGVYTMLAPEFRDTQEGTLHFEHLRRAGGGLVHVADGPAQHLEQLDRALRGTHDDAARGRRFVEEFVRPYGIGVPATPRLVDALETLAAQPAGPPERLPLWAPAAWPALNRRGQALAREVARDVETKAIRRARKKVTERSNPVEPQAKSGWRNLARDYRALSYDDRVRFGNATTDCTPAEVQMQGVRPQRLDYPHAEVFLRVTSKAERKRLLACSKEPFTVRWIEQCVRPGDVVYDIGANVGAYSLVAAKKPSGASRVVAFEPSPANVASLCANIILNEAGGLITPVPVALSDCDGMITLRLQALQAGSARHILARPAGDESGAGEPGPWEQPVLACRLDEAIDRFSLPVPNHIKLDVDGGEMAVLRGAARTLGLPSLRTLLIEVGTAVSDEVTRTLSGHGLRLETRFDVTTKAGSQQVWYGLFSRDGGGPLPAAEPPTPLS